MKKEVYHCDLCGKKGDCFDINTLTYYMWSENNKHHLNLCFNCLYELNKAAMMLNYGNKNFDFKGFNE